MITHTPEQALLRNALSALDMAIPELKSEYPDEEQFWSAFAGLADPIVEGLTEANGEWAYLELNSIMQKHGLD